MTPLSAIPNHSKTSGPKTLFGTVEPLGYRNGYKLG
ncbi:unnamed protein product, partial [Rotaria magnacalcarata]